MEQPKHFRVTTPDGTMEFAALPSKVAAEFLPEQIEELGDVPVGVLERSSNRWIIKSTGKPIKASQEFMDAHHDGDYEMAVVHRLDDPVEIVSEFLPEDLVDAFTTDEAFLITTSTHPQVQAQWKVLSLKRKKKIRITDPGYLSAIALLESQGLITQERADAFRTSLPKPEE